MKQAVDYAFLHGGGQGSWVWDETITALHEQTGGKYGRALALDVPGCGKKHGRNTTNFGPDEVTAELLSDIAGAGMKDIVLVGHSQAGTVLPMLVEKRPDLFRRVVYVTCSTPLPGQTVNQMMGTGAHGSNPGEVGWPTGVTMDNIQQRFPLLFCNDMSDSETSTFMAKLGQDMWPEKMYHPWDWPYGRLGRVPSSYVICLQDSTLTVPWQEKFATRFKVGRQIRIDAGHQVMNTRPHALAEVLQYEASLA